MEQLRRGFKDFIHRTGHKLEQLGNLLQAGAGILVFNLGNSHPFIAFEHAVEHQPEAVGITAKGTGGLGSVFVTGQHGIDRTQNTLGQQGLALGQGYLAGRGASLQKDFDDFFVFDLQLRHGLGQGCSHLMQRQHGLFAGQNGVDVVEQQLPVTLHRLHFFMYGCRSRRQAGGRVAFSQITPALAEIIARINQQLECGGFAGSGLGGVFGDTLGQHPQLTCVADVLLVVVGLGIEVSKVGE